MAIPSSGQIDMATIRDHYATWGYSSAYDLASYRGLPKTVAWSCSCQQPADGGPVWTCIIVTTSSLPTGQISFSDFYGANLDPGPQPPDPGCGGGGSG